MSVYIHDIHQTTIEHHGYVYSFFLIEALTYSLLIEMSKIYAEKKNTFNPGL